MNRLLFLMLLILLFSGQPAIAQDDDEIHEIGRILTATETQVSREDREIGIEHTWKVRIVLETGPMAGQEFASQLQCDKLFRITPQPGQRMIVQVETNDDGKVELNIVQRYRGSTLTVLLIVFVISVLLIGGWNGVRALAALFGSLIFILLVFLPAILAGWNPILLAVITCLVSTLLTLALNQGFTAKSAAALGGTLGGVTASAVLAMLAGNAMDLSGVMEHEAVMLFHSTHAQVSLRGLLYAGIIIGALGAVMDVAVSIASSLQEIHDENPQTSFNRLFRHGTTIGNDVISTMVNTLILAYTGSSLTLVLLLRVQNVPALKFMSFDIIASEITRALAGSIGIVVTVPLTALLASWLYTRSGQKTLS